MELIASNTLFEITDDKGNPCMLHGSCSCGHVTYEVLWPFFKFVRCQCGRCQASTEPAQMQNVYALSARFLWKSGEYDIVRYNLPPSEDRGRWFCCKCGSPVPRMMRSGRTIVLPLGEAEDYLSWV